LAIAGTNNPSPDTTDTPDNPAVTATDTFPVCVVILLPRALSNNAGVNTPSLHVIACPVKAVCMLATRLPTAAVIDTPVKLTATSPPTVAVNVPRENDKLIPVAVVSNATASVPRPVLITLPDKIELTSGNSEPIDDTGNIQIPRAGKTIQYTATGCHSFFKTSFISLFVENGTLKRLNDDNTAATLVTGMGDSRVSYTVVAETIYFSNELKTGQIKNGAALEWGSERPPYQPTLSTFVGGMLYAGEYRVAITWIGQEESGTDNSALIAVNEGDGITLSNFPTPPAYVDMVGVYVSSLNGSDLYLYGEYRANVDNVSVIFKKSTIPLDTQFKFKPRPINTIVAHYGRIYYPLGDKLYRTDAHRYGLQSPGNYWQFDSNIQTVSSVPGAIYVGTEKRIYKITDIDGDSAANVVQLKDYGTVKYSECYDPDKLMAYVMSDRGFLKLAPDGIIEMSYDHVAIPFFDKGSMSLVEYDGTRYLVGSFTNGEQNPLANKDYNVAELARGSL